jgi:hypothetical protein
MTSTVRLIVGICLIVVTLGYMLPTGIAVLRDHPRVVAIALWNTLGMLLFGLGWIIALVLSLTGNDGPSPADIRSLIKGDGASSKD